MKKKHNYLYEFTALGLLTMAGVYGGIGLAEAGTSTGLSTAASTVTGSSGKFSYHKSTGFTDSDSNSVVRFTRFSSNSSNAVLMTTSETDKCPKDKEQNGGKTVSSDTCSRLNRDACRGKPKDTEFCCTWEDVDGTSGIDSVKCDGK